LPIEERRATIAAIMAPVDRLRLARAGALSRLHEIEQERSRLLRQFPDLPASPGRPPGAPRRELSQAARDAISRGQKRRWARWRRDQ